MLIVCPSCATSYQIDPASVGSTGRMVRCARCKTTWFADGPKSAPEVTAFVDSVIAEAEAQVSGDPTAGTAANPPASAPAPHAEDNFGTEPPAAQPHHAIEPRPGITLTEPSVRIEHFEVVPTQAAASEPVTVTDAPPLVPPLEHGGPPDTPHAEHDGENIDTFSARRQRLKMRQQKKRRSSRWTAIALVLFAFNVALVGARQEVVRFLPQTASLFAAIGLPVNLRHLKFENVRISKEGQDGVNMLIVEGSIVSTASRPTEVPRLRFAARNAGGQEVYSWTALPSRSIIEPGEHLEFNSRVASPPADASDIMVRFFNSQDAVAGAK